MGLSDKLASLNFDRYQSWKAEKKISNNSKPALLVFKGDVYQGLQAEDFKKGDLNLQALENIVRIIWRLSPLML